MFLITVSYQYWFLPAAACSLSPPEPTPFPSESQAENIMALFETLGHTEDSQIVF